MNAKITFFNHISDNNLSPFFIFFNYKYLCIIQCMCFILIIKNCYFFLIKGVCILSTGLINLWCFWLIIKKIKELFPFFFYYI